MSTGQEPVTIHIPMRGVTIEIEDGGFEIPPAIIMAFGPDGRDAVVVVDGQIETKAVGVEFAAGNRDGTADGCRSKRTEFRVWRRQGGDIVEIQPLRSPSGSESEDSPG